MSLSGLGGGLRRCRSNESRQVRESVALLPPDDNRSHQPQCLREESGLRAARHSYVGYVLFDYVISK